MLWPTQLQLLPVLLNGNGTTISTNVLREVPTPSLPPKLVCCSRFELVCRSHCRWRGTQSPRPSNSPPLLGLLRNGRCFLFWFRYINMVWDCRYGASILSGRERDSKEGNNNSREGLTVFLFEELEEPLPLVFYISLMYLAMHVSVSNTRRACRYLHWWVGPTLKANAWPCLAEFMGFSCFFTWVLFLFLLCKQGLRLHHFIAPALYIYIYIYIKLKMLLVLHCTRN